MMHLLRKNRVGFQALAKACLLQMANVRLLKDFT